MRRTGAQRMTQRLFVGALLAAWAAGAAADPGDPPHVPEVARGPQPTQRLLESPIGAVPGRIEGRPIAPPIVNAPHGTPLSSGDQIQLQLYRDLLQTRQRQLEDRGGPFAGVEALRNQQN